MMPQLHVTRRKRLRFTPSKFCLRKTSFTPELLSEMANKGGYNNAN